jgi:hypothetical protein
MHRERILRDGQNHRSCAVLVAGVILHRPYRLCSAIADSFVKQVDALDMRTVVTGCCVWR